MRSTLLALVALLAASPARGQQSLSPPPPPPRPAAGLRTPPPPPPAPEPATATSTATPTATPTATSSPTGTGKPLIATEKASEDGVPVLGVLLDAGFPDGIGASLLYRPAWFARLHGGATYNFMGPGLRAGATLVPFHFFLTPTLSAEYGHTFDADATRVVSIFSSLSPSEKILLRSVGYDYLSVQVGLETGSPRTFAWFTRVGLSWIWPRVNDIQAAAQAQGANITSVSRPKVRVVTPSISTGIYLFVW